MRKYILILFLTALFQVSCEDKDNADLSGIASINNELTFDQQSQTYNSFGFLFSTGKLVSILDTPPPDITVDNDGTPDNLILQTGNFRNSFYKAREYGDAATAKQEFEKLISVTVPAWESWAVGIRPDQIWIFRTSTEKYAKIRIISIISEVRGSLNYAECSFEWVYQPDGSLTFPGK